MIIVKTNNPDRFGVTVTLPGVGLQTPDHNGEFVVPHLEGAEKLVANHSDFYLVGSIDGKNQVGGVDLIEGANDAEKEIEDIKEKSDSDELTTDDLVKADQIDPLSAQEKEIFLATLPGKTNAELKDDCKLFGLPAKEWRNLNKAELIAYITSKI